MGKILLNDVFCELNDKYSMKLLAGADGLNSHMSWFHLIESSKQILYTEGSELIITTGMVCDGEEWVVEFIEKLIDFNCCGLIVNIGPYIPKIPDKALALCNEFALPLFTVPWDVKLVELTRDISQLIIDNEKSMVEAVDAMKSAIFSPHSKDYKATLASLDIDMDVNFCASVISSSKKYIDDLLKQVQEYIDSLGIEIMSFIHQKFIVLISRGKDDEAIQDDMGELFKLLQHQFPKDKIIIGIGKTVKGIDKLSLSYINSEQAWHVAKITNKNYMHYDDIGIFKLLLSISDSEVMQDFLQQILGKIIQYDKEHGTDYIHWLRLYINCDGSVKRVSELAFCHRNTVNYKVKRLQELFDIDTHSNEEKMKISVALSILDVLEYTIMV